MIRALDMFGRNEIEKEAPHLHMAGTSSWGMAYIVGRGGRGRGEGERPGGLCGPRWTWTPGISGSDGTVRVTRGENASDGYLEPSDEPDVVEVPIYSLDRVLEEYGPFDVMKMGCEGCEYNAILSSKRTGELRQIQMEYHYGPERLVEALRNTGFEVRATRSLARYICALKRELGCGH